MILNDNNVIKNNLVFLLLVIVKILMS